MHNKNSPKTSENMAFAIFVWVSASVLHIYIYIHEGVQGSALSNVVPLKSRGKSGSEAAEVALPGTCRRRLALSLEYLDNVRKLETATISPMHKKLQCPYS